MILKKYTIIFVLCFAVLRPIFLQAQEIPSPSPQSTAKYYAEDIADFYAYLKVVDDDLKKNNLARAKAYALLTELHLKNMKGENEPKWCAELALAFAKVGLKERAKLYQDKATAVVRGKSNGLTIPILDQLAQSYTILNDKQGLQKMYEKVISTAPKSEKRTVQIAYVNSLYGADENVKASNVLTELYTNKPLSAAEQAEILSLLIINSLKLNQQQQLDQYFRELIALKTVPSPNFYLANGMYQTYKHRYVEAANYYQKLAVKFNAGKMQHVYTEAVLQLANLKSATQQKDSAEFYFSKVAKVLQKPLSSTALGLNYLKFFRAHQVRFKLNISATDRVLNLKDSLFQNELMVMTKELTYKYKIEQDKQKAALIEQQRTLEALLYAKKRQKLLWIISSLALLLLGGGTIIFLLYQRKKQSQLLHLAELERLKQLHKTDVIKKLSAAQEAERWRIADQLHDEVGSMISVVRLNLSEHPLKNEAIPPEKLEAANRILANVADTVREMSHQLMPVAIRQYGLVNAIEQLINDINVSGKIYIEHLIYGFENPAKYPEDFQISFYRIVQELFQNIVKHSKATNAIFQLIEHSDSINLYIEDNGKGIDKDQTTKDGKGIGLLTNRIDYFEGKISIEGSPGKGTLIVIDIPTAHMMEEVKGKMEDGHSASPT